MAKRTASKTAESDTPKGGGKWREDFLTHLRDSGNVRASCKAGRVSATVVYEHRKADREFAAQWDEALDQACDSLVEEAHRRAEEGVKEPVYYKGKVVGHIQKYSDTLLMFLLKAHRPAVYRETVQHEHILPQLLQQMADEYGVPLERAKRLYDEQRANLRLVKSDGR